MAGQSGSDALVETSVCGLTLLTMQTWSPPERTARRIVSPVSSRTWSMKPRAGWMRDWARS